MKQIIQLFSGSKSAKSTMDGNLYYQQWQTNSDLQLLAAAKNAYADALYAAVEERQPEAKTTSLRNKLMATLLELAENWLRTNKDTAERYLIEAMEVAGDNVEACQRMAALRKNHYQAPARQSENKHAKTFENLVFQGGGVKGIAYLGAIEALVDHLNLTDIKRVGGASAGAINALLLGLGYTVEELRTELVNMDLTLFMDGQFRETLLQLNQNQTQIKSTLERLMAVSIAHPRKASAASAEAYDILKDVRKGLDLLTKQDYGLFPGEYFRQTAERLIQQKTGIPYATFADLQQLKTDQPAEFSFLKDLYFVGVNLNTGKTEVFSHEHTPNLIVSDALRISMSIPIIFKPHRLYVKENGIRKPDPANHWYVDGGLLDNYPNWLFDQQKYTPQGRPDDRTFMLNPYTLGFRLVQANYIEPKARQLLANAAAQPKNLTQYMWKIIGTIYGKQESDSYKWGLNEARRTIYIDYKGVGTTEFDLTEEKKLELVESGQQAVEDYFNWRVQQEMALFQAAAANDTQQVLQQMVTGISLNNTNQHGKTCLDLALEHNNTYLIVELVKQGAYRCQAPRQILPILEQARQSGFVNAEQVGRSIDWFNAQQQPTIQPTRAAKAGLFKPRPTETQAEAARASAEHEPQLSPP